MTKSTVTELLTPFGHRSAEGMRLVTALHLSFAFVAWIVLPESVFPGIQAILGTLRGLWIEDALGRHILTSVVLNLQAIACVVVLMVPLAYARTIPFFRPVVSVVGNFRFLGLTGLTLIFTAYSSGAHSLKLSILTFSVGVYYLTSLARIVDAIPTAEIDYARTLGMGPWRSLYEIVIRGRAAEMFESLRQNAAMGWMMLTAVEGIAKSEGGVGTLLLASQRLWRLDEVYAIQLSLWVLGLFQDYLFGVTKRAMFPYADLRSEKR